MKIRRFAALALLNILNNLLHAWNLIAVLERNFTSILRSIHFSTLFFVAMDGEGGEQRDHMEHVPGEPMDEDDEAPVMGLGYDVDDEDDEDVDEENDDASDMSSETDSDYFVEMDSDDASDNYIPGYGGDSSTNSESESEIGSSTFSNQRIRMPNKPIYTFKPQRLMKCNYKKNCAPRDYPFARSGHRVVASESHLYTLGGYNPSNSNAAIHGSGMLFQELWRFNLATKRWVLLHNPSTNRNMPGELASNALIISNNLLIVSKI